MKAMAKVSLFVAEELIKAHRLESNTLILAVSDEYAIVLIHCCEQAKATTAKHQLNSLIINY